MATARWFLGLMSGTSADGVDAVVARVTGRGTSMRAVIAAHASRSYPARLRHAVLAAAGGEPQGAAGFVRLNWELGGFFADTAQAAARQAGIVLRKLTAVGSHGQTICHVPPAGGRLQRGSRRAAHGTWQIAEPTVIAERLGVPVVARFREADMAAGGQGAPLVPWTDYVLLRDRRRTRIVQNIGGIANLTLLPAGGRERDVIAFDCGPGNMLIDGLAERLSRGKMKFDRGGAWAARGRVIEPLLREWLAHPYFKRRPPKSCGREEFGRPFADDCVRRFARRSKPADLIATATQLTARTIADAYQNLLPLSRLNEVILCGGGARNHTLRSILAAELPGVRLRRMEEFGIGDQQKEALSFALLAAARIDGIPANLPAVTGASRRVLLGQVYEP